MYLKKALYDKFRSLHYILWYSLLFKNSFVRNIWRLKDKITERSQTSKFIEHTQILIFDGTSLFTLKASRKVHVFMQLHMQLQHGEHAP